MLALDLVFWCIEDERWQNEGGGCTEMIRRRGDGDGTRNVVHCTAMEYARKF